MEILGLEKLSLVDYEGYMCATIFTGGCNFFCPFCHNSGLVKREVKPLNTSEVMDYLRQRKGLLDAVTISGGEPTIQEGLEDFCRKVKELGYKVKLDTNGTHPEVVENLINKKLIDYVAMDIKNNFDDYAEISGVKKPQVEKIKQTLSILRSSNIDYELRTTLVAEYHYENNIRKLAEDLKGEKLLYLQKFVDSGALIGEDMMLNEVLKENALDYKKILEEKIDKVVLRGY